MVIKHCGTCAFYFPHDSGFICAGHDDYYGKNVDSSFCCEYWEIEFTVFCEVMKAKESGVKK